MRLFLDLETTGLILEDLPLDDERQPWPVEISALLEDDDQAEVSAFNVIIKPDGWEIPREASDVHKIRHDYAEQHGAPLAAVLSFLGALAGCADTILSYNYAFDSRIIAAAAMRKRFCYPLKGKASVCVMDFFTSLYGSRSTLRGAYEFCTRKKMSAQHTAMGDVQACRAVYHDLRISERLADQELQKK